MKKDIHIVPHKGEWAVKMENNPNPVSIHPTQTEAINSGKPIAQSRQSELVIHRPNGQIREAWSYGNDPYPPQG